MRTDDKWAADIEYLGKRRIAWMWSDELPPKAISYRATLGTYHATGERCPVVLRGSREVMYFDSDRRRFAACKFIRRVMKRARVCGGNDSKEVEAARTIAIHAAHKRWPNVTWNTMWDETHLWPGYIWAGGVKKLDEELMRAHNASQEWSYIELRERERMIANIAKHMRAIRELEQA